MTKAAPFRTPFVITKEYRRFVEFCDECRTRRYIGICYGAPGVGKTLSAWQYAHWTAFASGPYAARSQGTAAALSACRSILYTPTVAHQPRHIHKDLTKLQHHFNFVVAEATKVVRDTFDVPQNYLELILVDEADRLNMAGLEQLRDTYDRTGVGLILIGQPGIEKKLSRYAQLYSRVGFAHLFRSVPEEDMRGIIAQQITTIEPSLHPDQVTDPDGVAAMIHVVAGNLRLLQKLCAQISRTLNLNDLHHVTKAVVETAREGLVIGEA